MSRKKILLIGPLPPPMSGPEIVTKNLANSKVLNENFDIKILNTTLRSSNKDKGKLGVTAFFAYIAYIYKLIAFIVKYKIDIVFYLPTSATRMGWVRDGTTIIISKIFSRKIMILMQGGHFSFFYSEQKKLLRKIIKTLLNKCNIIFTQAERLRFQFENIVKESKMHTLYNAIHEDFYSEFDDVLKKYSNENVNILFIGHLTYAKGYCDLLQAFSKIKNAKLTIMGTKTKFSNNIFYNQATKTKFEPLDPDVVYDEYIKSNDLTNKFHYLGGKIQGKDKINTFLSADIFVLPSYSEGFSTAIIEAMAAKLPVVISDVGAAPEFIKNGINGYIIQPGDINALTKNLQTLIDNPELRKNMGEKNRIICKNNLSLSTISNSLLNIIEKEF